MPTDDDRIIVQARVKRASVIRLDEIAAERPGWTRSDALRHLLGLGLAAYDAHDRRAQITEARRARLPKGSSGAR